jgi:hypothetical protein
MLSARQLNRATLDRQLLLRRERTTVTDAVRRLGVLQAQEPASPYLALWARVAGFDPADLDAAFADGEIVKSSLLRITLHAVHADDHPVFHRAMLPSLRAARLADRRFTETGVSADDVDAALPSVLRALRRPHGKAEAEALLAERFGDAAERVWWAIRTFAPLHHAPSGTSWTFGPRPSYVAAPSASAPDHGAAVAALVRRYLAAFGPATVRDVAQFTLLRRPVLDAAVAHLGDQVVRRAGPDGVELVDVADGEVPDADIDVPPRLLPMWDSVLLAYADRSRVLPDEHRPTVIRRNGDVLPTLLVDGEVVGVWRATEDGIEATAFRPLGDDAWAGLHAEARDLRALLEDRDPNVYRRYVRWFTDLPVAERRLLGR